MQLNAKETQIILEALLVKYHNTENESEKLGCKSLCERFSLSLVQKQKDESKKVEMGLL
jgi:hypothetical protein